MDRSGHAELILYKNIQEWIPMVGDIVIRHGWLVRTKWFGVINFIYPDGSIDIIRDGMMKLLVMSSPGAMKSKTITVSLSDIKEAMAGSYAIMQHGNTSTAPVWYV